MATKQARGTKRTCQSDECGARFYDLNRDPIVCPICGSIYEIASGPVGQVFKDDEKPRRAKKETVKAEVPEEAAEEIEDIETEDTDEAEADDTFLEDEEEDGGDVSTIVGGREDEEEP